MKADLPSTVALSRDSGGCSSAASSSAKWTMILSQRDKERRKTRGSQQSRQIMLPTRATGQGGEMHAFGPPTPQRKKGSSTEQLGAEGWESRSTQRPLLFSTACLRGMAEWVWLGAPAAPQGPAHSHTPGAASPTCLWKSCEEPRSVGPLKQRRSCSPGLGQGSRGRPRLSGFCLHLLGSTGLMT